MRMRPGCWGVAALLLTGAVGLSGAPASAQLAGPQTQFIVQVPQGSVLTPGYYFNAAASDVTLSGDDRGFTVQLSHPSGRAFRLQLTPPGNAGVFPSGVSDAFAVGATATATSAGMELTEVNGPACSTSVGDFRIAGLAKTGATIDRVALHYRISCAGNDGASAFGTLFINQPPGPLGEVTQSEFVPMAPVRLLDTRTSTKLGPRSSVVVDITANGSGVPANATAVALNITAITPDSDTFLSAIPHNRPRTGPLVSNVNARRFDTVANLATVSVGENGAVQLYNDAGNTDAVVDIVGFYLADDNAVGNGRTRFTLQDPQRKLDTRGPNQLPLAPGETRVVDIGTAADAVLVNITAVDPTTDGYLSAFPADATQPPLASTINFAARQTVANSAIVKLDDGRLKLHNPAGTTHVIVDLLGTFAPDSVNSTAGKFVAIDPTRVYDSRSAFQRPLANGETRNLEVLRLDHRFTFEYSAIVANITATNTDDAGFLLAFRSRAERPPLASNLNWSAGESRANQIVAGHGGLDSFGFTSFYHEGGNTDLIIDTAGYYTS